MSMAAFSPLVRCGLFVAGASGRRRVFAGVCPDCPRGVHRRSRARSRFFSPARANRGFNRPSRCVRLGRLTRFRNRRNETKGGTMRLSNAQIADVKEQTGAEPIPEEHPNLGELREAFGDHTFYLDQTGLHVLESAPAEEPANENEGVSEDRKSAV